MHNNLRPLLCAAWLAALFLLTLASSSAQVPTIRLTASRPAALSNGRDSIDIFAEVRDTSGNPVADGTTVNFSTTLGNFLRGQIATTRAGTARVQLVCPQNGEATITAAVNGGGVSEPLKVTFTSDPSETYQGNAYVAAQSNGSSVYDAGDRIIELRGRPPLTPQTPTLPGAHVAYRNIDIYADVIQLDATANVVRASGNVVLRKGKKEIGCHRLFYPLTKGDGYAVMDVEEKVGEQTVKRLGRVVIKGDLKTEPAKNGIPPKFFEMKDIADASLVITATQILLFPGSKLQFKRPRFYQDGQPLLSMPFYSIGLYSTQLFTDQFLSVGSQGFGVDMPYYYDMTPGSTGVMRIRHLTREGHSVYATEPGWSLDMTQAYNSVGGSTHQTGQFGFTGLNRSDWSFRWNHSQEFTSDMRGTMFLDFPQHRAMFASTNLTRQLGLLQMGLNLSANRSLTGISTSGSEADVYLETMPRRVGHTGYTMALSGTTGISRARTTDFVTDTNTQSVQARFYSNAFHVDHSTTLTNYVTLGNIWASGSGASGGASVLSSVTATRTMKGANLQVSYDFTHQPTFITGGGNHRVSMNLFAGNTNRWSAYIYGSSYLDVPNTSLIGDFSYMFIPRWRFTLATTLQRFATANYRDYEIGIARSIGGRDVYLSYSTYNHRFYFDLQASRF